MTPQTTPAHPDDNDPEPPETLESIQRDIRLNMRVMNIDPHNQAWINDHVARLVEIANGKKS